MGPVARLPVVRSQVDAGTSPRRGNGLIRYEPTGTRTYTISDHLGSLRALVNDTGTVIRSVDYAPFGEVYAENGQATRREFLNLERDRESELGDHGVRKYDAELGRFVSVDPLWEAFPSVSAYQYAHNSPIASSDVNGLFGLYFDKDGRKIGDDNIDDNKKYLTKAEIISDATDERTGVVDFDRVRSTRGTEELPSSTILAQISADIVTPGRGLPGKDREFGGVIGIAPDGSHYLQSAEGDEAERNQIATIDLNPAINTILQQNGTVWRTIHTHPGREGRNMTPAYLQSPSPGDLAAHASVQEISPRVNSSIVVGGRNSVVYFYDALGVTVSTGWGTLKGIVDGE